jgi:hypothetical protein
MRGELKRERLHYYASGEGPLMVNIKTFLHFDDVMSYLIIIRNQKRKVMYDIRSLISGNPATEKRQFSFFFSLTPFYLALVCAGKVG